MSWTSFLCFFIVDVEQIIVCWVCPTCTTITIIKTELDQSLRKH